MDIADIHDLPMRDQFARLCSYLEHHAVDRRTNFSESEFFHRALQPRLRSTDFGLCQHDFARRHFGNGLKLSASFLQSRLCPTEFSTSDFSRLVGCDATLVQKLAAIKLGFRECYVCDSSLQGCLLCADDGIFVGATRELEASFSDTESGLGRFDAGSGLRPAWQSRDDLALGNGLPFRYQDFADGRRRRDRKCRDFVNPFAGL